MTAAPITCADCNGPFFRGVVGIFDGQTMRACCDGCAEKRILGPVPVCAMPAGTVIGRAAVTGVTFERPDTKRSDRFGRGCFAGVHERAVSLGVDHGVSSSGNIDARLAIATTQTQTLILAEDLAGLFFVAWFPLGARVHYGDDDPGVDVHEAIADGRCAGVSLFAKAGTRSGDSGDVFTWRRCDVDEISIVLAPLTPASPGTWCAPTGPAAMARYYEELRAALDGDR